MKSKIRAGAFLCKIPNSRMVLVRHLTSCSTNRVATGDSITVLVWSALIKLSIFMIKGSVTTGRVDPDDPAGPDDPDDRPVWDAARVVNLIGFEGHRNGGQVFKISRRSSV